MDNKTIHQIKFYQDGVKQEDGHAVRWQVGTYVPSIKATIDAIKHNTYHMKMFGEPCRTIICKQDGVSFDWKDYIGFSNGYGIEITYKTPTTDIDQRERELEQGGLYDED